MKTRLGQKARKAASALLTTLVICSILSVFVLYYLSLIDQQNYLGARSQTWNMAIVVSEAGIEDGIAQLNANYPNLATDNWVYNGATSSYSRSNSLPDGNGYTVTIYVTNSLNPTIVARAYVNMPPKYAQSAASSLLAAIGTTQSPAGTAPVTRAVEVTCSKGNLYLAAMVARNTINLNGNGVTTDSYDSSDPTKSTNGQYDPAKYKGDKGDVATDLSVIDSLNVGNANIYGHAHTGPNSPANAITWLPNCIVGSHAWAASNSGVEPNWYVQDANFTFPNTAMPNTLSSLTPTGGVMVLPCVTMTTNTLGFLSNTNVVGSIGSYKSKGTTYYYALLSGYTTNNYTQILWGPGKYVAGSVGSSVLVIGTNATLVVTNGLSGSENFSFYRDCWNTNNGASPSYPDSSVTVYAGGTSCSVNGNQTINQPGYPADFVVFCSPSVTSCSFSGNAGFCGVLVAPSANITMNGGGNNSLDFCGALMVNSVTMNGHFNFHYDEALSKAPSSGRFLITAWNEIN